MSEEFAGSEIVRMGVEIEKNGRDFYNTLVNKTRDSKIKGIFEHLALEEEKHISVFEQILKLLENYEPAEVYPGEYFAYMKVLAGEHVFTQKNTGAEVANKAADDKAAVDLGIEFEKDSIIFYEGMKKVVSDHEHDIVNGLIAQEQNHLRKLVELKGEL